MTDECVRMHLVIRGKVQGVSFRFGAKEQADRLKVRGWVKNLPNGDVELMATGNRKSLEGLLGWAEKGPPEARVTDVRVRWGAEQKPMFTAFEITR